MSTLYLIRHSQASFGKADYDCLSDLGQAQSKILADHFHNLELEFDTIYSGSLLRHEQTLTAYLDNLAASGKKIPFVHKNEAFNEYDSENILKTLIPEMIREEPAFEAEVTMMFSDKRSFQMVYEKVMRKWINSANPTKSSENKPKNKPETWKTYSDRVRTGLNEIMATEDTGKKIAVYTSGGPISVCIQKALNLSDENTLQLTWQIMNASVTRLIYSGNRLALSEFNNATHLALKKDSKLITYR
ncbi:MAG: histidine phosphatase family protein [Desulfobacteraceae bacterium]|jgi:broad specificity phosphatase PhoE|nr:histidine phosphatase family protein [Desulfobacteraceae bacterium]